MISKKNSLQTLRVNRTLERQTLSSHLQTTWHNTTTKDHR